jgi:hypothetical protein
MSVSSRMRLARVTCMARIMAPARHADYTT